MSREQVTWILGEWEGYDVGTVGRSRAGQKGPTAQVWIELVPRRDRPMICSGCGRTVQEVHETTARWVRDLPILDAETHLLVHRRRVWCPVCGLKEDLKHLWDYRHRGAARTFWHHWYARAIHSRIEPLKTFARRLKDRIEGVLAHCRWPFHTSLLEGINNKIKVIKRMAYGYRDDDYFFLKIRAAFPGIGS